MAERLSRLRRMFGLAPDGARLSVWVTLILAVLVMHVGVVRWVAARAAEFSLVNVMPPRIEVAYVREMTLSAPPAVAPLPPKPAPAKKKRTAAAVPAPAASAPEVAIDPPAEQDAMLAKADVAPEPLPKTETEPAPGNVTPAPGTPVDPSTPESTEAAAIVTPPETAASAPAVASAAAAVANAIEVFDWPTSTRLTYALTGNYRGEVLGSAQVEWIRSGTRYQVHLDLVIGASVAPLISRRMSSDGDITPTGLSPRRYDEDTKVVFRDRRRLTMLFEPDAVVMPSGERRERWPGVQDTASQFVQLTFMFTLNPELLRVGKQFVVPLALPKNIDRWTYEVMKEEVLYTPFGQVNAFHVMPRRITQPGSELRVEIWFAPQLRYLPVRIRIEQDAETYAELMLDRRPQIAAE